MARIIAAALLFIPGILVAFGIKIMRDAVFNEVYRLLINVGVQFTVGLVMFIIGLAFIGGFIYHRDKKRNLVKEKNY